MKTLQLGTRVRFALCIAAVTPAISAPAASQAPSETPASAPLVVAQAPAPAPATPTLPDANRYPAHQAGVRAVAAQGTEALRRYIHRTRMIYGFYYNTFAPKE
jgi:hypothetical protein